MCRERSPLTARERESERERERKREREVVRSQLRDFPSASVAHRASYCMDVLHVTSSSAPFDWLFDAFGPIVWRRGRGFTGRVEGTDFRLIKRCLGKTQKGFAVKHHPAPVGVV